MGKAIKIEVRTTEGLFVVAIERPRDDTTSDPGQGIRIGELPAREQSHVAGEPWSGITAYM